MIIVSNTSPINYLILIGQINFLPELFKQISIPQEVYSELFDDEVKKFDERFSNYQQATQWVIQLSFGLIASATVGHLD